MKLIDSHCHLDQLAGDELAAYLASQERFGVTEHILAGVDPASWKKQQDICAVYNQIRRAAGIHPWALDNQSDETLDTWLQQLEGELSDCIAVGEVGLDLLKATPIEKQLKIAQRQLDIAVRYQKPIIAHVVKAHNEFLHLIESHPSVKGIIHAFSSSLEMAQRYVDKGFLLGLGHTLIHPKRDTLIKNVPLEHVVFESDAPLDFVHAEDNIAPTALRVLRHFAKIRDMDADELAAISIQNCQRLFGWPAL